MPAVLMAFGIGVDQTVYARYRIVKPDQMEFPGLSRNSRNKNQKNA
jgi:hypothetical protein